LVVQRWCRRKESLGKVGEARRGPKRSLASVHRGSSRSEAQQPSEWPPTGCLQGILQETQGISTGSLLTSTGCPTVGDLGDGEVMEWYGGAGMMEMELVMAQG